MKRNPRVKTDGRTGTLSFEVMVWQDGTKIVLSGPAANLFYVFDGRPDGSAGPTMFNQLHEFMGKEGMWLGPAQDSWSRGAAKPRPPTSTKGASAKPLQGGAMETDRRRH